MSVELEWPDGIEEISYEEFERRVHDGQIPDDTLIRFEVVTGNRFVPARDLELFQTLADPDIRAFRTGLRGLGIPFVTAILVGIQLRVYLLSKTPGGSDFMIERFANWSPAIFEGAEVHRLLSYGFLQVGFAHLVVNLVFLAYVGWNLERGLGSRNLACIFLGSVFAGGLASLLMTPLRPSLGSSGGAFGLLAAAVVFGWKHGDMIPDKARKFFGWGVLPYLVLSLGLGLRSPSVDNWGHFGGLVGGGLLATLLEPQAYRAHRRGNRFVRRGSFMVCLGMAIWVVHSGPSLLRKEAHVENGLLLERPSTWKRDWTFGGDQGWVSPLGRRTLVSHTAVYPEALNDEQSRAILLNLVDAWGTEPKLVAEETLFIGEIKGTRIALEYRQEGELQQMDALLIPRGRLLHRVQLFGPARWSWRYGALTSSLFEAVEIRIPDELRVARIRAVNSHLRSRVFVELGEASSTVGLWEEAREAFSKALELKREGDSHARATEGLLHLHRYSGLEGTLDSYLDHAAAFPEDVGVQLAAAMALERLGEIDAARNLLVTSSTGNPENFTLRRALIERRLSLPEMSAPQEAEP